MTSDCRWVRSLVFAVALSLGYPAQRADACGSNPNFAVVLGGAGQTLLAGSRVIKVHQSGYRFERGKVTLTVGRSGMDAPLAVAARAPTDWLLEIELLESAIEEDAVYTLTLTDGLRGRTHADELVFTLRGAPRPERANELGTLRVTKPQSGALVTSSCPIGSEPAGVQAAASLTLTPEAAAFSHAVAHQFLVDGEPAFAPEMPVIDLVGSPEPLAVRAFAVCEEDAFEDGDLSAPGVNLRLSAARHEVKWQTTFDDGTVLVSGAQQLDLRCPTPGASAGCALAGRARCDAGLVFLCLAGLALSMRRTLRT